MTPNRSTTRRVVFAAAMSFLAFAARSHANDDDPHLARFPDLGLEWKLPPLAGLTSPGEAGGQLLARYRGRLCDIPCDIEVRSLPLEDFGFSEPDDITRLVVENYQSRRRTSDGSRVVVRDSAFLQGPYAFVPYASMTRATRIETEGTLDRETEFYTLCGLLMDRCGVALEIKLREKPSPEVDELILESLRDGIRYSGPNRVNEWTDEELETLWGRLAPESACGRKYRDPIRSEHYVIMTNSSSGKSFAKKMEANYREIQKVYPFPEVEGRRLMPVFLFRTNQQYYEFCQASIGWSIDKARASKGHASRDYYATWYESPNDPVHIHEATHQIFRNRLHLNGGGSWFQEGVAEYIETSKNDRNNVARQVERGEATSMRSLMELPSLLYSSHTDQRTGNKAHDHYKQAALLIEFFRESRTTRDRFAEFLAEMGATPRNDLAAIEAVLGRVYQIDLKGIEDEFTTYCRKR